MTTAPGHAWMEYFACVDASLAVLKERIYTDDRTNEGSDPARMWWLGFLLRAQRLLEDAALLARSSESADGVAPLCRTAYESAIYAMWVRADASRVADLEADLMRVQATQLAPFADEWRSVAEATRKARLISLEQIVRQVATWAADTTPTFAYRLTRRHDGIVETEPIRSDGEPYASSYVTLYRLLSGQAMHGPGLARGVVDATTGRLLRGRSMPDPDDVLVLVAEFAMAAASRCFGWGILSPPADLSDESRLEWEARHMHLRVAARAVADDDPEVWPPEVV